MNDKLAALQNAQNLQKLKESGYLPQDFNGVQPEVPPAPVAPVAPVAPEAPMEAVNPEAQVPPTAINPEASSLEAPLPPGPSREELDPHGILPINEEPQFDPSMPQETPEEADRRLRQEEIDAKQSDLAEEESIMIGHLKKNQQEQDAISNKRIAEQYIEKKKQIETNVATEKAVQDHVTKTNDEIQTKIKGALNTIKREDEEAKTDEVVDKDGEKVWSIWGKIAFALAAGISGAGQAMAGDRGPNRFIQAYQNAKDSVLKGKKLTEEQRLAKEEMILKKQQVNIRKAAQATNEKNAKTNLMKVERMLQMEGAKLHIERLKLAMKQQEKLQQAQVFKNEVANKGLTREQYLAVDEKRAKSYVYLPSMDRYQKLTSPTVADKTTFAIGKYNGAVNQINMMENLMEQIDTGDKILASANLSKTAASLQSQIGFLIGENRVEVLGPGVMTPAELEYVKGLIGDPTKFADGMSDVEKTKMRGFLGSVQSRMIENLRATGLQLPPSKNEARIEAMLKKNPKLDRITAVQALQKVNEWDYNFNKL
jgi:hypothetical protein